MNTAQKLAAARRRACVKAPYLASAIHHLVYWEAPGLGTFAVTADSLLLYDPAVLDQWSTDETAGVLVHEVCHVLREHARRAERAKVQVDGPQGRLWNVACDAEINDDLASWSLPGEHVLPANFGQPDGQTAEVYYRALLQQQPQQAPQNQPGQGQPGQGQPAPGTEGARCGSATGVPHPGEAQHAKAAEAAGVGGRTPTEQHIARRATAEAVQAHAKTAGRMPGGLSRWAEQVLGPPVVRWQDRLARVARRSVADRAGSVDYTYSRPSRRQAAAGLTPGSPVLPTMRAPDPRVMLAVDTSGSMSRSDLGEALAEAQGIFRATGREVDLCVFDAAVHALKPVRTVREAGRALVGGGGTSFAPVIRAAEQRRPRPDVLIIATDGYASPPPQPRGINVIWLLVGASAKRPVSWGEAVYTAQGKAA